MSKQINKIIAAYAIIALVTYGHVYNNTTFINNPQAGDRMIAGVFCGALWPLYLSVKLWENHQ